MAEALLAAALSRVSSALLASSACFVLRNSSWVRFNSFSNSVTRSSSCCERSEHPAKQIANRNIAQNCATQIRWNRDLRPLFPLSLQTRRNGIRSASIFMRNACCVEHNSRFLLARTKTIGLVAATFFELR